MRGPAAFTASGSNSKEGLLMPAMDLIKSNRQCYQHQLENKILCKELRGVTTSG